MKILFALFVLSMSTVFSFGQNGVNTARMVNAISPHGLHTDHFEFEPNLFFSNHSAIWDENGSPIRFENDSTARTSGIGFRTIYSPTLYMEVGGFFASDLNEAQLAVRYTFLDSARIVLCAYSVADILLGEGVPNTPSNQFDSRPRIGFGIGSSTDFLDGDLIIDASMELGLTGLGDKNDGSDFSTFIDVGYYVTETLLLFNGIGYTLESNALLTTQLFSLYPGFAIESSDNFIIAINSSFDLSGKNREKTVGGNIALTLCFD